MYFIYYLCLLTPTICSYMLFLIVRYYYYMLAPCLDPEEKQRNSFTWTKCRRGLEIFCLSGPARQRFDLTFKNSSPTFHEVCVNFYVFCSPSFSKIITLFQQERSLKAEDIKKVVNQKSGPGRKREVPLHQSAARRREKKLWARRRRRTTREGQRGTRGIG